MFIFKRKKEEKTTNLFFQVNIYFQFVVLHEHLCTIHVLIYFYIHTYISSSL